MNFATPAEYNDHLIENLTKISLEDYLKTYHEQFYPEQDISFMPYLMEISDHKSEFYVPHTKLFEYGVMDEKSNNVEVFNQLTELNLKDGIDFNIVKVSDVEEYALKPNAFKKLLMIANTSYKQSIDIDIYLDYYLLLEEVYADYNEYRMRL